MSVTAIIPACRGLPFGVRALLSQDVEVRVLVLSNGSGPTRVPDAEVIPVEWQGHGATRQAALKYVKTGCGAGPREATRWWSGRRSTM